MNVPLFFQDSVLEKMFLEVMESAASSMESAVNILNIGNELSGTTYSSVGKWIRAFMMKLLMDVLWITIAHRIPTIIDSDLVLVLDQGEAAEYDSPARLQSNHSSAFSKLVNEFLRRSS